MRWQWLRVTSWVTEWLTPDCNEWMTDCLTRWLLRWLTAWSILRSYQTTENSYYMEPINFSFCIFLSSLILTMRSSHNMLRVCFADIRRSEYFEVILPFIRAQIWSLTTSGFFQNNRNKIAIYFISKKKKKTRKCMNFRTGTIYRQHQMRHVHCLLITGIEISMAETLHWRSRNYSRNQFP